MQTDRQTHPPTTNCTAYILLTINQVRQKHNAQQILTLSQKILTLSQKILTLSQKISTLSQKILTLSQKILTLSQKILTLSQKILTLTEDINTLTEDINTLTEDINTLTEDINTLTEDINTLTQLTSSGNSDVALAMLASDRFLWCPFLAPDALVPTRCRRPISFSSASLRCSKEL